MFLIVWVNVGMSDKEQDNVLSLSKRKRSNFLNSDEGQEVLSNAFDAIQSKRNEQPLTFAETTNQRQYCQWQIRLLDERVDRGYLSQPSEIEHVRDQLAAEIREIRNDWSNTQWREFVEQEGDVPVTTYANSRSEVKSYVDNMRSEWKSRIPAMQADDEEFDLMEEKRTLESDIFDIENTSLKTWNERGEAQEILEQLLNPTPADGSQSSPIVNRIKKFFETDVDAMSVIAMTYIRDLHGNDRLDECHEAIDWGVENDHLTEFEAASLRKGKLPDVSSTANEPPSDEPSF